MDTTTPTPQKKGMKKRYWIIIGAVLLIFGIINSAKKKADLAVQSAKQEVSTPISPAEAKAVVEKAEDISNWSYNETMDKMDKTISFFASTESPDLLNFEFPYNGGSTVTMTVRKNKTGNDVFVKVSKGQFMVTSYEDKSIRVKFDDGKPIAYNIVGAADGSSDLFFFRNTGKLIQKIKASKKMMIECEFYNEGIRQIEFNVSGLNWSR